MPAVHFCVYDHNEPCKELELPLSCKEQSLLSGGGHPLNSQLLTPLWITSLGAFFFLGQCCLFNGFFALEKAGPGDKIHTGIFGPRLSAGCSGIGSACPFLCAVKLVVAINNTVTNVDVT